MQQNYICKSYQILFKKFKLPNDNYFENVTIVTVWEGSRAPLILTPAIG